MKTQSTIKKLMLFIAVPLLSLTLITACGDDDDGPVTPPPSEDLNLVELAQDNDDFSTLVDVIVDLGLDEDLASGEFTVFAPTNDAFDDLPDGVLESLTEDQLLDIIQFHVTEGSVESGDLEVQQDVEMLNEELTLVRSSSAGVNVNGSSEVVDADLIATNGVIHAIDEVLLPRDIRIELEIPNLVDVAEEAGDFETLLTLAEDAGLITTLQFLGPYTAFAPNDDAFAELGIDPASLSEEELQFILTYHVISDAEIASGDLESQQTVESAAEEELYITSNEEDGVVVNGNSQVIDADVDASNGIIHVVDNVLLPNAFLNTVEVAQKNYNFTTLVDLIVDANLAETVASDEFTVFAPTNDAFEDLFAEVNPDDLSADQVEEILLYHTIPAATIASGDLEAEQTVASTTEEDLYITAGEDVVVNGNSTVTTADVESNNGVIHAVDSVLLPNSLVDVTAIAQKNYNLTSLVNLLVDFNLVETLQGDGPFTVFAPTNEAFDAISEVVEGLSDEEITEVLTYHVLAANVESGDIVPPQTATMLNEQDITIDVENDVVTITDAAGGTAEVVVADQVGTNGVVHIIDAVLIPNLEGGNGGGDGELLTNGDFEDGRAPWTEGAGEIREEGGNSYFYADVETAGNPWDVNLSQVVELVDGENYILEFDASTGDGNTRTMIAGIGLNEGDYTSVTEEVNLTDETQTFTLEFTSNVGSTNGRVLFDMGAEAGVVVIDNVSLTQGGSGGSGDDGNGGGGDVTPPDVAAPTPPSRDAANVISLFSNEYDNITVDEWSASWDTADIEDVVIEGNDTKRIDFSGFLGVDFTSNPVDASEMTHFHIDFWTSETDLVGKVFNSKWSNHADGDGETNAYDFTYELTGDETGQWVSIDIPLSEANIVTNDDASAFAQFLITSNLGTVFVDNIYLYKE